MGTCWNCNKCKKDFSDIKAEKYVTYKGIDYHHNPPQFMFRENEKWKGELLKLCRSCHTKLHKLILEILHKYSCAFKKNNSEYWAWKKVIGDNKIKCRENVYESTKEWLND